MRRRDRVSEVVPKALGPFYNLFTPERQNRFRSSAIMCVALGLQRCECASLFSAIELNDAKRCLSIAPSTARVREEQFLCHVLPCLVIQARDCSMSW